MTVGMEMVIVMVRQGNGDSDCDGDEEHFSGQYRQYRRHYII